MVNRRKSGAQRSCGCGSSAGRCSSGPLSRPFSSRAGGVRAVPRSSNSPRSPRSGLHWTSPRAASSFACHVARWFTAELVRGTARTPLRHDGVRDSGTEPPVAQAYAQSRRVVLARVPRYRVRRDATGECPGLRAEKTSRRGSVPRPLHARAKPASNREEATARAADLSLKGVTVVGMVLSPGRVPQRANAPRLVRSSKAPTGCFGEGQKRRERTVRAPRDRAIPTRPEPRSARQRPPRPKLPISREARRSPLHSRLRAFPSRSPGSLRPTLG